VDDSVHSPLDKSDAHHWTEIMLFVECMVCLLRLEGRHWVG
jgi:hypothetical protein